jgi:hypothetical protein
MEQFEKQQREESKRKHALNSQIPKTQFNMLLSGPGKYPRYTYMNNFSVHMTAALVGIPPKNHQQEGAGIKVISIEPALAQLREEYNACKIIRLDDKTHSRLMEFAKSDESILDLLNRILDMASATEAKAAQIGEKTAVS